MESREPNRPSFRLAFDQSRGTMFPLWVRAIRRISPADNRALRATAALIDRRPMDWPIDRLVWRRFLHFKAQMLPVSFRAKSLA
jgi:hypothetical protein